MIAVAALITVGVISFSIYSWNYKKKINARLILISIVWSLFLMILSASVNSPDYLCINSKLAKFLQYKNFACESMFSTTAKDIDSNIARGQKLHSKFELLSRDANNYNAIYYDYSGIDENHAFSLWGAITVIIFTILLIFKKDSVAIILIVLSIVFWAIIFFIFYWDGAGLQIGLEIKKLII